MGQKVNPIANRLGVIRGWDSNWYGGKDFSSKLVEDAKIREYLNARLAKASISKIIIERTLKLVTVTISTARPYYGSRNDMALQKLDKKGHEIKELDYNVSAREFPKAPEAPKKEQFTQTKEYEQAVQTFERRNEE